MQHTLWRGKSNAVAYELVSDGSNLDAGQYAAISRVVMRLRPVTGGVSFITLDSDTSGALITWGGAVGDRVVVDGSLLPAANVPAGWYHVRVLAYSVDHPDGMVFVDYPNYWLEVRA